MYTPPPPTQQTHHLQDGLWVAKTPYRKHTMDSFSTKPLNTCSYVCIYIYVYVYVCRYRPRGYELRPRDPDLIAYNAALGACRIGLGLGVGGLRVPKRS